MPTAILIIWFLGGAACGAIVVREFYTWQRAGLIRRVTYRVFSFFWTAILISGVAWALWANEVAGGFTFIVKITPNNATEKKNETRNIEGPKASGASIHQGAPE